MSRALALLVVASLSSCKASSAREDERFVKLVDDLIQAAPEAREARLLALKSEPCSHEGTCRLQALCSHGHELQLQSRAALAEAKRRLEATASATGATDQGPREQVPEGLLDLLARAQSQLSASHREVSLCLEAQAGLRLTKASQQDSRR